MSLSPHPSVVERMLARRFAGLSIIEVTVGVAITLFGLWRTYLYYDPAVPVVIAFAMGVAATLYRRAPSVALALVWLTGILQIWRGLDIAIVQLAAMLVAYGTARYGSRATLWVSILSIPIGAVVAVTYVHSFGGNSIQETSLWRLIDLTTPPGTYTSSLTIMLFGFLLLLTLLGAPWVLGLVQRLRMRRQVAEAEAARAQEELVLSQHLTALQAERARIAQDVHDVVGHSLAVIIAQADSTRVMGDDVERMRETMANIAASARESLGEVRRVLADEPTKASATRTGAGDLDSLVEGLRSAGDDVRYVVSGTPRTLDAETGTVSYRALQELLTNALKHGQPGEPLEVTIDWAVGLTLTVRNTIGERPAHVHESGGLGLVGMRERVAALGGELVTTTTDGCFTAVVTLPLSPVDPADPDESETR